MVKLHPWCLVRFDKPFRGSSVKLARPSLANPLHSLSWIVGSPPKSNTPTGFSSRGCSVPEANALRARASPKVIRNQSRICHEIAPSKTWHHRLLRVCAKAQPGSAMNLITTHPRNFCESQWNPLSFIQTDLSTSMACLCACPLVLSPRRFKYFLGMLIYLSEAAKGPWACMLVPGLCASSTRMDDDCSHQWCAIVLVYNRS